MIGIGWTELVLVIVILLFLAIPVFGAIDAGLVPESAWRSAKQNKVLWIVLQVAGIFVSGIGLIPTLIYFLAIRPKVRAKMQ